MRTPLCQELSDQQRPEKHDDQETPGDNDLKPLAARRDRDTGNQCIYADIRQIQPWLEQIATDSCHNDIHDNRENERAMHSPSYVTKSEPVGIPGRIQGIGQDIMAYRPDDQSQKDVETPVIVIIPGKKRPPIQNNYQACEALQTRRAWSYSRLKSACMVPESTWVSARPKMIDIMTARTSNSLIETPTRNRGRTLSIDHAELEIIAQ